MLAPRRRPPCFTTSVVVSKMRMKPTGPEATRPVLRTWSPRGRRWVKEKPVPPPVWWIRAMSRTPFQDGAHVVKHRDDEAGGQLSLRQAGVHQGGGVGQEFQGTQGLVEGLRSGGPRPQGRRSVPRPPPPPGPPGETVPPGSPPPGRRGPGADSALPGPAGQWAGTPEEVAQA